MPGNENTQENSTPSAPDPFAGVGGYLPGEEAPLG